MHVFLLLVLALLTGCWPPVPPPPKIIDDLAFSEVIIPYSVELSHSKRLRFEDSRIYVRDDDVKTFRVVYSTQQIIELCEARGLMVDIVEELLMRLNAHPLVVEAVGHYPVEAEDIEIIVSFESYYIEYDDPTYIVWMTLHDGLVYFYSGVLKDWTKDFWHQRIEPYWKSVEYVRLEREAEGAWEKAHPKKELSGYRDF